MMKFARYKDLIPEHILHLLVEAGFLASGYRIKNEAETICYFLQNLAGENHAYPVLSLALLNINQRDYVRATKILIQATKFKSMPPSALAAIHAFLALVFFLRQMESQSHYYAKLAIDNSNDLPIIDLAQSCLNNKPKTLLNGQFYVK